MTEDQIIERVQHYAAQIHLAAQARQKPGAALANYMRMLRLWDEHRASATAAQRPTCPECNDSRVAIIDTDDLGPCPVCASAKR